MHDADLLGDFAGERAVVNHVYQIHRHVVVDAAKRAHFFIRDAAGGADRAVLVHDDKGFCEGGGYVCLSGDLAHAET